MFVRLAGSYTAKFRTSQSLNSSHFQTQFNDFFSVLNLTAVLRTALNSRQAREPWYCSENVGFLNSSSYSQSWVSCLLLLFEYLFTLSSRE